MFKKNHKGPDCDPFSQKKKQAFDLQVLASSCGEKGIRTLGTQSVQRFSRPPRSTTPASLLTSTSDGLTKRRRLSVALAETEGFEPPKPFGLRTPEAFRLNGFQDRRYRPLSHISAAKVQHFSIGQEKSRKKTFFHRKPVSLQD